jgi:hypothetical protein
MVALTAFSFTASFTFFIGFIQPTIREDETDAVRALTIILCRSAGPATFALKAFSFMAALSMFVGLVQPAHCEDETDAVR